MDNGIFEELVFEIRRSRLPLVFLAHRAGVCKFTLYNWLDGKVKLPRLDTALKVAAALNLTIDMTAGRAKLVSIKPRAPAGPKASHPAPPAKSWRWRSSLYRWQ